MVWKDLLVTHKSFEEFQNCLNSQCKLNWTTVKLNTKVNFMNIITLNRYSRHIYNMYLPKTNEPAPQHYYTLLVHPYIDNKL